VNRRGSSSPTTTSVTIEDEVHTAKVSYSRRTQYDRYDGASRILSAYYLLPLKSGGRVCPTGNQDSMAVRRYKSYIHELTALYSVMLLVDHCDVLPSRNLSTRHRQCRRLDDISSYVTCCCPSRLMLTLINTTRYRPDTLYRSCCRIMEIKWEMELFSHHFQRKYMDSLTVGSLQPRTRFSSGQFCKGRSSSSCMDGIEYQ